nr:hypothetical protein [Streptomyces sp. LS1784]
MAGEFDLAGVVGVVDGGDDVAVGGEFLGEGGVEGAVGAGAVGVEDDGVAAGAVGGRGWWAR